MVTKNDNILAKALIEKGLVTSTLIDSFLEQAAKSKETLYALLLKNAVITEGQALECLAEHLRLKVITLAGLKADTALLEKVPLKIAEYYKMAPIKLEKRKLTIAVSVPLDLRTLDDIRAHLGFEIEMVLARESEVAEALKRFYGFAAGTIEEMIASPSSMAAPVADGQEKIENIEKMAGDASIARLVNQIIVEAFKKRATDIHIEPYRGKVKLRYRIDGILYNANVPPEINRFLLPVLSRIKIMSNLNIVERRLPQDGRAIVRVEDTTLDLRVSSIPTPYGESVVIRMLPLNRVFGLEQLGLNAEQQKTFEKLIKKPHGIIFITGPTGSGKSTTLYACLNRINTDERKIITIEDPVEYEMDGVTQIQVMPAIGLDFSRGLRSMLRHDPDVMMVGEVRDLETAEIAMRVALTGHLVFSTLHTNDAASGITRLIDIGVEPYLVASSVEAFIAQRLVRLICKHCKEEDHSPTNAEVKRQMLRELGLKRDPATVKFFHGKGCPQCNFTGFWGRLAIYEILLISEKVKTLIMKRATAGDIKQQAIAEGMRTLRQDGWHKVLTELTAPEEILKEGHSRYGDRRVFMRLDYETKVQCKEAGKKTTFSALTKNISAGGLSLAMPSPMALGFEFEVKFEIKDSGDPIQCPVKVLRVEEAEPGKLYIHSIAFTDLAEHEKMRIEKFIEKEIK